MYEKSRPVFKMKCENGTLVLKGPLCLFALTKSYLTLINLLGTKAFSGL
jgi:hypothetical protein